MMWPLALLLFGLSFTILIVDSFITITWFHYFSSHTDFYSTVAGRLLTLILFSVCFLLLTIIFLLLIVIYTLYQ